MSRPLILVVDDEPNIRETVSYILELEGFRVETAEDGEQALEAARRLQPKVILLDVMMPHRDGFSVCSALRADPTLWSVQIVMLTALGQKVHQQRALEAGADYYLTKPFDEDELLTLLRRLTQ
jgi:DNA-binding response OmpR family regulator